MFVPHCREFTVPRVLQQLNGAIRKDDQSSSEEEDEEDGEGEGENGEGQNEVSKYIRFILSSVRAF